MKKDLIEKLINIEPETNLDSFVEGIINLEDASFSDSELIPLIKQVKNNDLRCWALLKVQYITNSEDAGVIIKMLTADDSRQRELASEIVYKHICCYEADYRTVFIDENFYEDYVSTLKDINPRVTRNIIACYSFLEKKTLLFNRLIYALQNFEGYYVYYWALEGMNQIIQNVSKEEVLKHAEYLNYFFNKIIAGQEELLKEKVALVLPCFLKCIDLEDYRTLKNNINRLKNDKNFYVRQAAEKIL